MSTVLDRKLRGLASVVDLREREKDRLLAELATKQALAERYRNNLARLEDLCQSVGGARALTGAHLSALSQNRGEYKISVMQLATGHRSELQLHEADMRLTQQALVSAVHRHEAMAQILARQRESVRSALNTREQKSQDEIAIQSWLRAAS